MDELMRVGVLSGPNLAEMRWTAKPKVEKGQILVKIEACALCTFEQRMYTGLKKVDYPYVGGHEVAGHIAKIGEGVDAQWQLGQKVALRTFYRCGQCDYCHQGEDTMCTGKPSQRPLEAYEGIGGLSDYFLCDPSILFPLRQDIDIKQASLTEPLSCVLHSIDQANIDFGETVMVVGAGIMGLLHTQLARMRGAKVVMVDIDDQRLSFAREMGANEVINPSRDTLPEKMDVIIYTPANAALIKTYLPLLNKKGRLVLYGSFHPDHEVGITFNQLHYEQLRIIGAVNPGTKDFLRASRMINHQLIDLSPYISDVYPVEEIDQAFKSAVAGGRYRVVVTF